MKKKEKEDKPYQNPELDSLRRLVRFSLDKSHTSPEAKAKKYAEIFADLAEKYGELLKRREETIENIAQIMVGKAKEKDGLAFKKGVIVDNCFTCADKLIKAREQDKSNKINPALEYAACDLINFIEEKLPKFLDAREISEEIVNIYHDFEHRKMRIWDKALKGK